MSAADDARSVLLALRLRGALDGAGLVAALETMDLVVDDAATLLQRLELAGLVEPGAGTVPRLRLTADGRAEGERLLAAELDAAGTRRCLEDAYGQFLGLNGPLLRVCTDWQLRDAMSSAPVANDHRDPAYDRDVLDALGAIHELARPVTDGAAACLSRYAAYRSRLDAAHDRIEAGDLSAVDGSTDSYHGVWFELHEDLIATLGFDRASEPLPDTSRRLP